MNKCLVVFGPTSTGKTGLALQTAKKFNGELVSCDSRQVYKKLDIGTGKLPDQEIEVERAKGVWKMDGVKVWMYDVADPKRQYTVFEYVKDANRVIEDVQKKGKLPIIVGGTGLYLKALLEGLSNPAVPVNKGLRKKLEKLTKEELQKKLQQIAPDKWNSLNESDQQNPRRLIRAIELSAGKPQSMGKNKNAVVSLIARNDILKIGLIAPREILYQRIDKRVISRIKQRMIDEAEKLHNEGLSFERMKQLGLEYGVLADYMEGKIKDQEELIKVLQGKIHGYARRQITWFKKEKEALWFDITKKDWLEQVESKVSSWYYSSDDQTY